MLKISSMHPVVSYKNRVIYVFFSVKHLEPIALFQTKEVDCPGVDIRHIIGNQWTEALLVESFIQGAIDDAPGLAFE